MLHKDAKKGVLILPMDALDLAVVSGRVGADELMPDARTLYGGLKQGGQIAAGVGEAVGELKAVVSLDALDLNAAAFQPGSSPEQKVGEGISGLLLIGPQETQTGELADSSVLEQPQLRVGDAGSGNNLDVYLHTLAKTGHLLIGFGMIGRLLFGLRGQAELAQDTEQALRPPGVTSFLQPKPEFRESRVWISTAHIPDKF